MGAVETARDALFGNPPSPATEPSREGILAAFTELSGDVVSLIPDFLGPNNGAAQIGTSDGSTVQESLDTLQTSISAVVAGATRYRTKALMDAVTTADDGALAYVFENNGNANDAANGYYQWDDSGNAWDPADWVMAQSAAAAQSRVNAAAPNLVPDYALHRAVLLQKSNGGAGIPVDSDPANPFGGGSWADSSGLIRVPIRLTDTPFIVGDHINIRTFVNAASAKDLSVYCADEAGVPIGSGSATGVVGGANDKTLDLVIQNGTVKIIINVSDEGGAAAKLFAKAFAFFPTTPRFTEAGQLPNRTDINFPGAGRTIALFGDSIIGTSKDLNRNSQGQVVTPAPGVFYAINDGMALSLAADVINVGFGGTTLARRSDDANYDKFSMAALVDAIATGVWTAQDAAVGSIGDAGPQYARLKAIDWSTIYGAVFCFGTNDYGASQVAMGSDTDTTGATFKGAVTYITNTLLAAFPHLRLLFVTPAYRARWTGSGVTAAITGNTTLTVTAWSGLPIAVGQLLFTDAIDTRRYITALGTGTGGTGTYTVTSGPNLSSRAMVITDTDDGDTRNNSQTLKLTDYAAAIKSMAQRNHIACLDMYGESGITKFSANRLTQDGLHPTNDDGIDWWVDRLSRGTARLL